MKILTCALQFGTSNIKATAATRDELGRYEILAIESEPSEGCVRYGCIANVSTAVRLTRLLINKLTNRVKQRGYQGIDKAYIGVGGLPLQRLPRHVALQVSTNARPDSFSASSEQILLGDIKEVMQRAGIGIEGFIAIPLAASRLLTDTERQNGVVLVDLGASTSTVSIYKGGSLQHLAVIPIGGMHVTRDITGFAMGDGTMLSMEEAERVKCEQSDASGDSSSLPKSLVSVTDIIICRYEEIAANVLNQIRRSGIDPESLSCVLTGGAALQRGLTTLFGRRLGISKIAARSYNGIIYGGSERKPQQATLTAMLNYCENSCEIEEVFVKKDEPVAATPTAPARPAATQPVNDGQGFIPFSSDEPETDPVDTQPKTEEPKADGSTTKEPQTPSTPESTAPAEEKKPEESRGRLGPFGRIFADLFGGANDGK